ncbi:hypothetical protein OAE03_00425 [Winogradskyella sp.]|nr:hypothetical protein [Winogradskyella sp.]MDC1505595.1 hypothetical protein [Winogradskyella sp.]
MSNVVKKHKRYTNSGLIKIKYNDFTLQTQSKTLPYYVYKKTIILETAKDLLYQEKMNNSVRLLGIALSNLNTDKSVVTQTQLNKDKSISVQLQFEF